LKTSEILTGKTQHNRDSSDETMGRNPKNSATPRQCAVRSGHE